MARAMMHAMAAPAKAMVFPAFQRAVTFTAPATLRAVGAQHSAFSACFMSSARTSSFQPASSAVAAKTLEVFVPQSLLHSRILQNSMQVRTFAIRRGPPSKPRVADSFRGGGRDDDPLAAWAEIAESQMYDQALSVNVQNNDVEGALKRLKRKAIEDGVMKKWRDRERHTKPAVARRFTKQLNVRRAQRRRVRENLRLVYDQMKADDEVKALGNRIANDDPDLHFPSYLPFDETLEYPTEPTWPLPAN